MNSPGREAYGAEGLGSIALLRRLIGYVDLVSRWVIVVVMAGMAALVVAQVFQRYVMSSSIDAADELSRLFFVWAIFLALPHGIPRGVHVGIDVLASMFPIRAQEVMQRLSATAGCVLMAIVFYTALGATGDKWNELMPTLPLSAGLYYVPVLICAAHATLHLMLLMICGPGASQSILEEESVG